MALSVDNQEEFDHQVCGAVRAAVHGAGMANPHSSASATTRPVFQFIKDGVGPMGRNARRQTMAAKASPKSPSS